MQPSACKRMRTVSYRFVLFFWCLCSIGSTSAAFRLNPYPAPFDRRTCAAAPLADGTLQDQPSKEHGQRRWRILPPFNKRSSHTTKITAPKSWVRPTTTRLRGGATVLLTTTNPALSVWLGPALACALAYALYNLFIKKASSSMDPILGGVLLQIVAAALGATLLGVQQLKKDGATLQLSRIGVTWAIAAGAAVGAAEILSFIISSLGVPASKSIPTVIGGSVVIGTLLGAVWLGERLTRRGWLGIVMIAAGIALVGIDPGASSLH
ncbi:EamA-like transporter family [Seminavis robusta]|uniref:EamA-like transporter family n=1 Tax=Seminavis robusta TaxID=568900 RepID=A0A9N8ERM4_9STRA|nr:EamA-like transporter family [Seminavis robusta]|eukprot:Sro1510_g278670.1 EamA-like transporter family (266) ;mRNA; r:19321-20118